MRLKRIRCAVSAVKKAYVANADGVMLIEEMIAQLARARLQRLRQQRDLHLKKSLAAGVLDPVYPGVHPQ